MVAGVSVLAVASGVPPMLSVGVYQPQPGGPKYYGLCDVNFLLIDKTTMRVYG